LRRSPSAPAEASPRGWRSGRELVFRAVQIALGPLGRALFRTTRRGHERVPRRGGILLAFNHLSFLDPVLLDIAVPRPVYFLAKRKVLGTRLTVFLLVRLCGHITVEASGSNDGTLDAAVAALAEGRAIALAPEGRISRDGRLQRGMTGVAILAYRTGCPVYPVGIQGSDAAWPHGKLFPRPLRRTSVTIGPPIRVEADGVAAADPRRLRELTDRVMVAIARLCNGGGLNRERASETVPR
jgi:1-acyl-sn-glycerol-3-phosphate acyltransferase